MQIAWTAYTDISTNHVRPEAHNEGNGRSPWQSVLRIVWTLQWVSSLYYTPPHRQITHRNSPCDRRNDYCSILNLPTPHGIISGRGLTVARHVLRFWISLLGYSIVYTRLELQSRRTSFSPSKTILFDHSWRYSHHCCKINHYTYHNNQK